VWSLYFSWRICREGTKVIHTILDACREVLEINGEPQSPYWLASQMVEMRMWKASEQWVRRSLEKDIQGFGENSRFMKVAEDEWALRSWNDH
jgi:DNA-directed RNA polymerase delta subunit